MAVTPGLVRGVGSCSGDNGHAAGCHFDGGVDDVEPLIARECWSLAGGAAGNEEVDAGVDLPRDQVAQSGVVDGAILMKGSDEGGAASTELHRDKIARMKGEENLD
jgi:hypothetical protein